MKTLHDAEIKVSLFIDPDLDQVKAAHRGEADVVELHTGRYCDARLASDRGRELSRIVDACKAASKLGIEVAAGHGLNYQNVGPIAPIAEIEELNIGHAIVARAVLVGFERAVREMKELIGRRGERRVAVGGAVIVGLGMDVVEVARIRRILDGPPARAERFLARCFTAAERGYCDGVRDRAARYAARFAAKEAASKALGAPAGIGWHDVEVVRGAGGARPSRSAASPRTRRRGSARRARSSP